MDNENFQLIEPTNTLRDAFLDFCTEYPEAGQIHKLGKINKNNFSKAVQQFRNHARGIDLPEGWIPQHTFWFIKNETLLLGNISIIHRLNETLEYEGGHIGYAIRPSERGKGYATLMLKMALEFCKKELNLKKALITCDKKNTASARVILKNGGKLENEVKSKYEGRELTQRYWIDI